MRTARPLLSTALLLCALGAAAAEMPGIDWALDAAIRQIDRQANDFDTAMARIEVVTRDEAGTVLETASGDAFFRENGDLRIRPDDGERTILLDGTTLHDWDRNAQRVTSFSLSRGAVRPEPFYRLGFSVNGRDMADRYLLTILGEEDLGGTRTLLVELTPERERERKLVSRIRLWIDQASWMPRRQEFSLTADRTVRTIDYTHVARNLALNPGLFEASWPRGTERVRGN